ncbi:MAG: DNA repair protein RecO [Holosporaceae bacterium]|jgi:DNA repair protein RecO (recombination protein O)|nr:DNA repair protein RecO [Holosporaceae bacterium]
MQRVFCDGSYMQWREEGIVLSQKYFSENSRIVTIFNRSLGKVSGLQKGLKTPVHPGDIGDIIWKGRTSEHLGLLTIENIFSPFTHVLGNSYGVFAIDSACSLCKNGMPEKAPHPGLFDSLKALMFSVPSSNWIVDYIFFEIKFLSEVGFGLDLSKCVLTGAVEGLSYVSPRTGRAVTKEAGEKYRNKLLKLPKFLVSGDRNPESEDIFYALKITEHFLRAYFYDINGRGLPFSRDYLVKNAL